MTVADAREDALNFDGDFGVRQRSSARAEIVQVAAKRGRDSALPVLRVNASELCTEGAQILSPFLRAVSRHGGGRQGEDQQND